MTHLIRKNLLDIPPYIPGRPIEVIEKEYGLSSVIKLASNENPLGPSPMAIEQLLGFAVEVHRYPDPDGLRLRDKISFVNNLQPENVVLGNGAAELIDYCALAFVDPGDEVIISDTTFPKYYLSARRLNGVVKRVPMKGFQHDVEAICAAVTSKTSIVFVDSPCNPVGCKLSLSGQKYLLENIPEDVVIVLDEAYREFVTDNELLEYEKSIDNYKNVIFLRTFSKIYGLAGMRVGYAVGNSSIISSVNRVREVFNVNSIALAAAEFALDDVEHVNATIEMNESGKQQFYAGLDTLNVDYQKSYANFVLIDTKRPQKQVDEHLLQNGVIVRPIKVGGKQDHFIRVSIGLKEENEHFIETFSSVLSSIPEE